MANREARKRPRPSAKKGKSPALSEGLPGGKQCGYAAADLRRMFEIVPNQPDRAKRTTIPRIETLQGD